MRVYKYIMFGIIALALLFFAVLNVPKDRTTSSAAGSNKELSSQAEWESGTGSQLDTTSTPGSIKIAANPDYEFSSLASDPYNSSPGGFGTDGTDIFSTNGVYTSSDPPDAQSTFKYDVSGDTWSEVASRNIFRGFHCTAGANGKLYLLGGRELFTHYKNVERYDSATNTWDSVASMTYTHDKSVCAVNDNKLYVFGGNGGRSEVYDIAGNSWSDLASMPTTQDYGSSAYLDGFFYVFKDTTVYKYDVTGNIWTTLGAVPFHASTVATLNGIIYVFSDINEVYIFNTVEETYTSLNLVDDGLPSSYVPRFSLTLGNNIYIYKPWESGGSTPLVSFSASSAAYPSATHTSSSTQIDAGVHDSVDWTTFAPSGDIPANTSINFRFRTSADSTTWSAWSSSTAYATSIDLSGLTQARYLQVESTLANTDGASTPTLDSYTANYDYTDAPPDPTCDDGIQNGDETGVDCGGSCTACPVPETCDDGIQNQDETGVDCGGVCGACPVEPTCNDGIQNGDETGVDTGGSCPAVPSCSDGVQNQSETGVDCGGECDACPVPETCSDGIQNQDETGTDVGGVCGIPESCSDGIKNQDETGVDCGGVCGACPTVCTVDECSANALNDLSSCQEGDNPSYSSCASDYCTALKECYNQCGILNDTEQNTNLIQPNGNERYNISNTVNVKWRFDSSGNNAVPVIMSVSTDGGASYKPIKLLIPNDNPDSPFSKLARGLNASLDVGSYQYLSANSSYGYNWIPGDPSLVSTTVRIRLEPQSSNCIIKINSDFSDNNFELWQQSPQLTLRISPNSARVATGAEASFQIKSYLDGVEVTKSTQFSYTTSRAASVKSSDRNNVTLTALTDVGFFDQALLVHATHGELFANSFAALEVYAPIGDGCGVFCNIVGIVKSFVEDITASQARRDLATFVAFVIGLVNLLVTTFSLSKSLLAPFVKGRDKRTTQSLVYDSLTGQPIAKARVMLISKELGNLSAMTLSDKEGKYSIEVNPGKSYQVKVEKEGYVLFNSARSNIDIAGLPYTHNYLGEDFVAEKEQFVFNKNLPMFEVDPAIEAKRLIRAARINAILVGINIPLILAGSGITMIILVQYPILFNYMVMCLYVLSLMLYLVKNWAVEGRGSGVVINNSEDGAVVDLALIRAIRTQSNKLAHTVLSDHEGRYSMALPRGIYEIYAVKTGLEQVGEVNAMVKSPFRPREDTIQMQAIRRVELTDNSAIESNMQISDNNTPIAGSQTEARPVQTNMGGQSATPASNVIAPNMAPKEVNDISELIADYRGDPLGE